MYILILFYRKVSSFLYFFLKSFTITEFSLTKWNLLFQFTVFLNSFKKDSFDLSKPYELAIFLLFLPFLVINIGSINTKRDRLI